MKKALIVLSYLLILAAIIAAQFTGIIDVRKIINTDTQHANATDETKITKSTAPSTIPALPKTIEKRIALVIGNAKYQNGGQLANTVNDANDITAALQRYQFDVILKTDADLQGMTDAIDDFGEKLKMGGVGLFFYSGHGIQIKGENYLVPIDATLNKESDVKRHMININEVLEKMGEGKTHLNLVFLDACRDNPFPSFSRSMSRGLNKMDAPSGTLIAYATSPNDTASDGEGNNSPYTSHLLNVLKNEPSTEIGLLLRKVTKAVKEETKGDQEPWLSMSIDGEFYFMPPTTKAAETVATASQDIAPAKPVVTDTEIKPETKEQPINPLNNSTIKKEITQNQHQTGYVCNVDPSGDNYLSLRTGPTSSYPEVLKMTENTKFIILDTRGSWYRVQLENGMTGWAFKRWICQF